MNVQSAAVPRDFIVNVRLVRRLAAFVAGSIAVHGLLLVAYAPGGGGAGGASEPGQGHVIKAVLAPAPAEASPGEAAQTQTQASAAEPSGFASEPEVQPQPGLDWPRPDKWYAGAELTVLAEPLIAPKLVYPPELDGSGLFARVRVRIFIDERGRVRKTELVQPGPHPAFDAAALKAWESVPFKPARKDGAAVKSQKLLENDFAPG